MNMFAGLTALAALAGGIQQAGGEPSETPRSQAPLFQDQGVLEFTLSTDFRQLKRDRGQESTDRPAEILVAGSSDPVPLQVRTRGNFRLRRSTCSDMPPIRLNFAASTAEGTVFAEQDKVKLVTHCRGSDQYERNTLQEYLAYRIYNLLTDISFRVRLARITYVDTSGGDDPETRYAFLIEDEDALAERVDGMILNVPQAHPTDYEGQPALVMALFQHMIGNTDWSEVGMHNIVLLRTADMKHMAIPYDFDWSGMVNARYAEPNETLGIRTVRDRLFRGFCREDLDYEAAFAQVMAIRDDIEALGPEIAAIDEDAWEDAIEYIDDYYDLLESDGRRNATVIRACRRA